MKYITVLLGIFATPLPMVLSFFVVMVAIGERMDASIILFSTLLVFVVIWVLILISKGILLFTPWQSRGAHLTVMFVTTMIPLLWFDDIELEPDAGFSYQLNDGPVQTFDFAIGGIIAMALIALISAMCMWVFWRLFVRGRAECTPSD